MPPPNKSQQLCCVDGPTPQRTTSRLGHHGPRLPQLSYVIPIIFTHFSAADLNLTGQFWFEDAPDQALLANRAEVRDVLESHDVTMAMNGHVHWNNHTVHNGISYITIQSLIENATGDGEPAGAWAVVEAEATHLEVTVSGREPARYRAPRLGL